MPGWQQYCKPISSVGAGACCAGDDWGRTFCSYRLLLAHKNGRLFTVHDMLQCKMSSAALGMICMKETTITAIALLQIGVAHCSPISRVGNKEMHYPPSPTSAACRRLMHPCPRVSISKAAANGNWTDSLQHAHYPEHGGSQLMLTL